MDRKGVTLSQQEYERIMRDAGNRFGDTPGQLSFGQRFEQALNNKFTDEVIGKMVGGVFGTASTTAVAAKPHTGIAGAIYDVLNTKFAAEIGVGIGQNITGLIKELGSDRIGRVIDNYTGRPPSEGQHQLAAPEEQISPEEQQKRSENAIMTLDSNNIEHLNVFMQATKIANVSDAQKALLTEQGRILQSRGLAINNESPQNSQAVAQQERQRKQSRSQPDDLNRKLMQQYENPDQFSSDRSTQTSTENSGFFDSTSQSNLSLGTQRSPNEIVLSLSPDDPTSIHQYSAMRNLSNLDAITIKKMLIKEQEQLRKNMLNSPESPVQETSPPNSPNSPVQDSKIDSSWTDHDKPRTIIKPSDTPTISLLGEDEGPDVMKKEDFYQEIGYKKSTSENQQTITQQTTSTPSGDISNIVSLIEGLGNNFESSMQSVSDNIKALNEKIELLENEIVVLKSKPPEIVYTDIPNTEDVIITKENISDIIKRPLRMASLNDITKEDISADLIESSIDIMNEIPLNDLSDASKSPEILPEYRDDDKNVNLTDFSNIGEDKQEIPENENENNTDITEKENNIDTAKKEYKANSTKRGRERPQFIIKQKSQSEDY